MHRHRTTVAFFLVVALWLLTSHPAVACPFCEGGPTGPNPVKEIIFGEHFWANVFYTALPFPAFAALAAFLHHGPPWRRAD